MKKTMISLLAAACAVLSVATASAQTVAIEQQKPYIEVRGTAKTTIAPNKIEVAVQLSELPSKGKVTLAEQEKQLATALAEAGVDVKKQLVVTSQSTSGDKRKISYQFKNYLLTVSTAEELGAVFTAFDAHGIQNAKVQRVTNDSQEAVKMQMRVEAMKNAQLTASTLAEAVGQTIGDAILVTDYNGGMDSYGNDFTMVRSAKVMMMSEAMPADLQMRPIEVEQNVTVRFLLLGK